MLDVILVLEILYENLRFTLNHGPALGLELGLESKTFDASFEHLELDSGQV
jgi:hypothetical protein